MNTKIKELLQYLIIIIVIIFIKIFIVTPIKVNGSSMMPTLHEGDIMLLNKTAYYFDDPKRFDIVVIDEGEEYLIKRVIGLPGEKIEYKNNILYIDGRKIKDKVKDVITYDFTSLELGSEKIPLGTYLVLGDNRTNSLDSRSIGFIEKDKIVGRTSLTILPINRIGNKK